MQEDDAPVNDIGTEVMAAMEREFNHEPDRVVAIVGGAYLDAMLDSLLRKVLIDASAEVDRLLLPEAPLGSNGTRYQLAYCMALITRDQRDDLKVIAKIRNKFAHSFKGLSFDQEPVRGLCSSLKVADRLVAGAKSLKVHPDEIAAAVTY